jgi:hypothetical protein
LNNRHAKNMQHMVDAVLTTPGETDTSLRRAIEARTAALGGRPSQDNAVELPQNITKYIDKVALHAYKTTDADIENLLQAGYSEDAIYICAYFNVIDRIADSLHFAVPSPEDFARGGPANLQRGYAPPALK